MLSNLIHPLRDALMRASLPAAALFKNRNFEVTSKGDAGPLTTADLIANRILRRELGKIDEGAGWLSEENHDNLDRLGMRRIWIVDPIDGTREFVEGLPEFSISVGLVDNGVPVLGGIALPAVNRLVVGGPGLGVRRFEYRTPPQFENTRPSPEEMEDPQSAWLDYRVEEYVESEHALLGRTRAFQLKGTRLLVSRSEHRAGLFEGFEDDFELIPTGSVARKLALLACDEGDLIVSLRPKNEWDTCGGTALVHGINDSRVIELLERRPVVYNQRVTTSIGMVAGNSHLVRQVLDYLDRNNIQPRHSYD
ncbi:MAG: hypothetical protein KDK34_10265 [Leptospiraceae bacterium]|nr:hypothetical protein [Leptospiraceae bacterium]